MKAFIRKIRSVKKRRLLKKCLGAWIAGMSFRYGPMSHKTKPSPFFVNDDQSNQHVERLNSSQRVMIVDDDNQFSLENKSVEKIRGVKLGSGNVVVSRVNKQQNQISEPLKDAIETSVVENESLTAQKSELTYSQDEIDALGLGQVNKEISLVVGLPMPHSSPFTLAVHEKNLDRLVQESNVRIDMEQKPKILMSRTSADLKNQKWIKELICSLRSGSTEEFDEELIRCILGKVSESELDIPSINKILERIIEATLSVGSNGKLMRILGELEKPIPQSPLAVVTPSGEVVKIPDNLQDSQHESESSSSIFVEGFQYPLPRHRAADALMDPVGPRPRTVLNGQRQNQQNTRTLSVHDGSQAAITEGSVDHLLSKHGHNFNVNDQLPPNANQKPTKHQQIRTRVNAKNRQQFLDEAQRILNDKEFSEPFEDIRIRGIAGRGYVYDNPDYPGIAQDDKIAALFIGIPEEGPFQGQIKKMQPISAKQLRILREQGCID